MSQGDQTEQERAARAEQRNHDATAHAHKGEDMIREAEETLLAQLNGFYRDLQAGKRPATDGDDDPVIADEPQP